MMIETLNLKQKVLIFHPALAPYRVDQFNMLNKLYDVEIVFIFDNVWNHKFDQEKILQQLNCKYSFLLFGPRYKGRVFRFGIYKKIRKSKPDFVFGYEFSFTTQYIVLLKRLGLISQKIGSTIDDSLEICKSVQSNTRAFARKQTIKKLDYIVVLSNEVASFYVDTFSLTTNKVIVSPILQNPERLRANYAEIKSIAVINIHKHNLKGKKVLIFVGRFIPEKGLIPFLDNIISVLINRNDFVLVIVGDGEEKARIEHIVKNNNLESKVILPGRYEGNELYAWYLSASGFVLPSTYEPFGAVVNEALIFGLKVLCSQYAGSSYLLSDNFLGLKFNPLDSVDTTSKLEDFLNVLALVDDTVLSEKKSLILFDSLRFSEQWNKLSND